MLGSIDTLRQIQGDGLSWLGLGPTECRYRIVASGARRRLRAYAGANTGLPLLIVAAPIKRPYIWDLADCVSVVRHCLQNRLGLYLLEWMPPPLHGGTDAGLADYSQSIGEAVAATARGAGAKVPFNGPFARRDARGDPRSVGPAAHPGARAVVDANLSTIDVLPGSLLSFLAVVAAPETFLWSRLVDIVLSTGDPRALMVHARVERWALDEFPLPGRLVHEILEWPYHENRLCAGTLRIGDQLLGPAALRLPVLAVANTADAVAPRQSIAPFIDAMPTGFGELDEYPGETSVGLQHLALLVGREAHRAVWPRIFSWLHAHG